MNKPPAIPRVLQLDELILIVKLPTLGLHGPTSDVSVAAVVPVDKGTRATIVRLDNFRLVAVVGADNEGLWLCQESGEIENQKQESRIDFIS